MKTLYSDIDPFCCRWLENLVAAGEIPPGDVLEADITKIDPKEVKGYSSQHWFAGVGGWPLALRLAGWPATRPVWSASCPCQPFSSNGRNKGIEDSRDLWPIFLRIVAERRPSAVFGEQSPRAIAFGWLDRLCDDMEEIGYAVGAAVLPACSIGAPHERSRLFWVADAEYGRLEVGRGIKVARSNCRQHARVSDFVSSSVPVKATSMVGQRPNEKYETNWPSRPERLSVVDGISNGVGISGRTRGYGNAIVPKQAAVFIRAFMEA